MWRRPPRDTASPRHMNTRYDTTAVQRRDVDWVNAWAGFIWAGLDLICPLYCGLGPIFMHLTPDNVSKPFCFRAVRSFVRTDLVTYHDISWMATAISMKLTSYITCSLALTDDLIRSWRSRSQQVVEVAKASTSTLVEVSLPFWARNDTCSLPNYTTEQNWTELDGLKWQFAVLKMFGTSSVKFSSVVVMWALGRP